MTDQSNDDQPTPSERDARHRGLAYQGAFEAVFAILIGAGLGLWADQSFDTSPLYLLIGTVIGFAAFVLRLIRLGKQLQTPPDSD